MARRARLSIVIVVTRGYYRMSSLRRLELAAHRLVSEPGTSVARLLGYANRHVLRVDPSGRVEVLWHDVTAHTLAHPTNVAFRGTTMFTANLGRWHLTRIDVGIEGVPLPVGARG